MAEEVTGEALYENVTTNLTALGLDVQNMVGQGYAGGSKMSGKYCGLQARMQQENPLAQYVHCHSHHLNLALCESCNTHSYGRLISQLQVRLCQPLPRLKAQYLLPPYVMDIKQETWADIKQEYTRFLVNEDSVDCKLQLWQTAVQEGHINAHDLTSAVKITYQLYPNMHAILKALLTMPVSTASTERSFSCLRDLKTYLRSTVTPKNPCY
ncbi:UNVERIFIED_CONTAM: hypothetical protein FKN15_022658 [Acipenser sinensis]